MGAYLISSDAQPMKIIMRAINAMLKFETMVEYLCILFSIELLFLNSDFSQPCFLPPRTNSTSSPSFETQPGLVGTIK